MGGWVGGWLISYLLKSAHHCFLITQVLISRVGQDVVVGNVVFVHPQGCEEEEDDETRSV